MPKKLKLVLREPVKLYETKSSVEKLPVETKIEDPKEINVDGKVENSIVEPTKKLLANVQNNNEKEKSAGKRESKKSSIKQEKLDLEKILTAMSPRVRQIWDYFCMAANEDGNLKNSFTVTRSEVMKKAGIGSTNTYRDALKKFQNDGLIEIELRPGVISGSVFYLTEKGRELAEYK